jgi:hypothetical protein
MGQDVLIVLCFQLVVLVEAIELVVGDWRANGSMWGECIVSGIIHRMLYGS